MAEKTKEQKTALAKTIEVNGVGLAPRTLTEMKLIAETFRNSGLVPKGLDSVAKIIVAVQAGAELGFKPWQSLQVLHVVNGRVGLEGQAMLALIRKSGKAKCLSITTEGTKGTDEHKAVVKSQRVDDPTEHITEFSLADAQQAGLAGKENWKHYLDDMLIWRAVSRHGRRFYSDVIGGFYTAEELTEIHEPDAAVTPEVPGREERKQAEDVKITDTNAQRKELLESCLNAFTQACEEKLGHKLNEMPMDAFTAFVAGLFDDKITDWYDPKSYDIDILNTIALQIKTQIPDEIFALAGSVPEPAADEQEEPLF